MNIKSKQIHMVNPERVKPHPKNNNIHPKDQKAEMEKQIRYQGFRVPLIISNLSGYLVSGHLRLETALKIGMKEIPVTYQDFEDEAQEYAFLTADNAIAVQAELDLKAVRTDILNLGKDFRIDLLGIKGFKTMEDIKDSESTLYTKKIEAPIYEPKGDKPNVSELYNEQKANSLIQRIANLEADIPMEVKHFLQSAAMRHVVFDYAKIAEFYAHSPKEVQELMEESALVIIDFDKAIEHGFVELSDKIAKEYKHD